MKFSPLKASPQQRAAIMFAIDFANYPNDSEYRELKSDVEGVIFLNWYPDLTEPSLMKVRRKIQRWLWDLSEPDQPAKKLKQIEQGVNSLLQERTLETQMRIVDGKLEMELLEDPDIEAHFPTFMAAYGCALLLDHSLDLRRHLHICELEDCQNIFFGGRRGIQYCCKQHAGLARTRRHRGKE